VLLKLEAMVASTGVASWANDTIGIKVRAIAAPHINLFKENTRTLLAQKHCLSRDGER